jgi:predicted double-glycine peptidase
LERASGRRAVTLDLPGYLQTNSYGCGAVAAVMVVRYFQPQMQFGAVYDAVAPLPEIGAQPRQVARAMRSCGLRVRAKGRLQFSDLCQLINAGSPVLVVIRNPGADSRHWVVVYGYRRIPDQVYLANNGLPFFTRNRVSLSAFRRLWEPKGNGLVCWKDPQSSPSQIANHKLKVAAVMHGHNPQAGGRQCPSGFSTHNMWRVWLCGQGGQTGCFTEPAQLFTPHNVLPMAALMDGTPSGLK